MITPAYAIKLGLTAWKTSVRAQKIDSSPLETYGMVSASFLLQDSLGKVRFFEETFLLVDTSMEIVLGILFLALSNADFQFGAKKLTWRSYIAPEALLLLVGSNSSTKENLLKRPWMEILKPLWCTSPP